jgi:hypothetical protein
VLALSIDFNVEVNLLFTGDGDPTI